jgi:hypothetical protein
MVRDGSAAAAAEQDLAERISRLHGVHPAELLQRADGGAGADTVAVALPELPKLVELEEQRAQWEAWATTAGAAEEFDVDSDTLLRGRLTGTSISVASGKAIKTETDYDAYGRVTESRNGNYDRNGDGDDTDSDDWKNRTHTRYNPPGTPSGVSPKDALERTQITQVQGTDGQGTGNPPDLVTTSDLSTANAAPIRAADP